MAVPELQWRGYSARCAVVSQKPKGRPLQHGRSHVQVVLVVMLDGEEMCAFTRWRAQDEKLWHNPKLKQEEFVKSDCTVLGIKIRY